VAAEGNWRSTLAVRRRRARRLRNEGVFARLDTSIFGEPALLLSETSRIVLSVLMRLQEVEVEGGEE
jgi:phage-related protein